MRRTSKEFIAAVNRWSKAIQNNTITTNEMMVYQSYLARRHTVRLRMREERQIADGRGGRLGGSRKSYDGEKAWSSINHSILSELS